MSEFGACPMNVTSDKNTIINVFFLFDFRLPLFEFPSKKMNKNFHAKKKIKPKFDLLFILLNRLLFDFKKLSNLMHMTISIKNKTNW